MTKKRRRPSAFTDESFKKLIKNVLSVSADSPIQSRQYTPMQSPTSSFIKAYQPQSPTIPYSTRVVSSQQSLPMSSTMPYSAHMVSPPQQPLQQPMSSTMPYSARVVSPQQQQPLQQPPQQQPQMIAQGTFGCVYKPSMECEEQLPNEYGYENKISKLMSDRHANKELLEYDAIEKADPSQEFYLGRPVKCTPKTYNESVYKGCNMLKKRSHTDKMSLLILKNGGDSLAIYAQKADDANYTVTQFELYWLAMYKFLHSLVMLNRHNLIHFDMKPQNIVYDIKTNDMKLIDFGTMRKLSSLTDPVNSQPLLNKIVFWWSFPWEMAFITRDKMLEIFQGMATHNEDNAHNFVRQELLKFRRDEQHINYFLNVYTLKSDDVHTIDMLFGDMYASELVTFYKAIHDKLMSLSMDFDKEDERSQIVFDNFYARFIKKSFDTFDLYGTGIAMMYLLNHATSLDIPEFILSDMVSYVYKIITPNVINRYTVANAITELQAIIQKYGWAQKHPEYIAANSKYFSWVAQP